MKENKMNNAIFSPDRKYRYILIRSWANQHPSVMFIGLNPSTADETTDDNTIRRCTVFAVKWGYQELVMANLYAFRSTDPKILKMVWDPAGPQNETYILGYAKTVELIILCWGSNAPKHRSEYYIRLLSKDFLEKLAVLEYTKDHLPKHPLYLKGDLKPIMLNEMK